MSSSMMRGLPHNNSSLNISSRRDNLIIQIDDSNDDSDDDTLHIVEESIDESIEIDDSASDEQVAIDLSLSTGKFPSSKNSDSSTRPQPKKIGSIFSSSSKHVEQSTNHFLLPKITVLYQPHHFGYLNGSVNDKNVNSSPSSNGCRPLMNGNSFVIQNEVRVLPTIGLTIGEVQETVNESFTYQCEFCSEQFSSDQLLIDHCARTHTKDVKCQHCDKKFYREKDLHFHMRTHIKKGRGFRCQICTGLFVKGAELKEHMKIHDIEDPGTEGPYPCNICDKKFKSARTLQEHKKRFSHKQCQVCLEYFSTDATLFQHFSVHVTQTAASYSSDQCDEIFSKKNLLKLHRDKHRLYVCEMCSAEFRRKDDIKSHLKMDCTKRSLYYCTVCNKSFLSEGHLKSHVDVHYERNKCEFCSSKFLHSSELFEHLDHHDIEHPYQCQVCLAPMASKRIFNFHLKSHNDETKYKCERCNRWFRSRYHLKNHFKSHSKDTYKCEICSMSFSDHQRLDQHLRSHEENEFQCDICKRSFRTRHLIFLHMIDSHQSRKKCHICKKEFKNQSRLMTHLKSHYVKVEFPDEDGGM